MDEREREKHRHKGGVGDGGFQFYFCIWILKNEKSWEQFIQFTNRFSFEFLASRYLKLDLMLLSFEIFFCTSKLVWLYSGNSVTCTRVCIEL
jgi:hypothetical protein